MELNNNAAILEEQLIIEQTLWELGVPPHLKGFYYLHDAISIVLETEGKVSNKSIYTALAEQHHVNKSMIERSIRHAIRVTFERSVSSQKAEWFGHFVDLRYDRPTSSVFIAVVAAQTRHKIMKTGRKNGVSGAQPSFGRVS